MNLTARRRDTERIINQDPWNITFYRRNVPSAVTETTFTAVGRVQPGGARMGLFLAAPFAMPGELPASKDSWLILLEWDATPPIGRDEVVATQASTSIKKTLRVIHCKRYGYKMEVICDESQ